MVRETVPSRVKRCALWLTPCFGIGRRIFFIFGFAIVFPTYMYSSIVLPVSVRHASSSIECARVLTSARACSNSMAVQPTVTTS
jgi:hypothetical protein